MFKRKLLLLTETFPPEIGGVQSYLAGQWAALPPDASAVIAPDVVGAAAWDQTQPYRVIRTPMRGWTYPRWRPALDTLARIVGEMKPDVLVCGKALFEGRAALVLQRAHSIPYVVMTYAMEINTWLSNWKTRRDLLHVLHGAARIVVINSGVKRLLLRQDINERKIVKIYPGVDESFFRPVGGVDAFRKRMNLEGTRVLVSVGRLVPRKGIDTVIRALPRVRAAFPNVVHCVIGDGPERAALAALAEREGVAEAVRFLGAVSQEDLRRALAVADLFVLTPRDVDGDVEGFGIAYIEAAATGLTAVGSKSGGVPEAVLDMETGLLVPPADPEETAQAILRLLKDDALRQRLFGAARDRAEKEFTWPRRALLFQGMIEAIMQEQGKARSTKFEIPNKHQ